MGNGQLGHTTDKWLFKVLLYSYYIAHAFNTRTLDDMVVTHRKNRWYLSPSQT